MKALTVLLTAAMSVAAAAQQPAQKFEVVSIKRSSPGAMSASVGTPPGRFVMVNMDVRPVIGTAYDDEIDTFDYVGLPDWATVERFDIEARAPEGAAPRDIALMVRSLLAERFAFKAHVETRQRPIYELARVNPGAPLPPGLEQVDVDCDALRAARQRGETPELKPLSSGLLPCNMSMNGGRGMEIQSGGMTMAGLGQSVQSGTGRIIVDRTGLAGYYAFTLRFSGSTAPPDSDPPVLFTALREQLGLMLQSATGPVRVLVIDRIERPTGN